MPKQVNIKRQKTKKTKAKSVLQKRRVPTTVVQVFDIYGRSQGTAVLPKEIFGQKPNEKLLSQAIRVYQVNQIPHKASTKSRGEVRGGGAKPWRQKHTGRARAGSRRSPLFVGGGIVFGPKARNVKLTLPKKMKKKALISALSAQNLEGRIKVISGFAKLPPKTKIAQNLLNKINVTGRTLLVLESPAKNVKLATRNIPDIFLETANNLNAYTVISSRNLLISKEALSKFL